MNFEILEKLVNSNGFIAPFLITLFAVAVPIAFITETGINTFKKCMATILILLAGGTIWWSEYLVPNYHIQTKVWESEQAKKQAEEKISNAPWKEISYETKVLTVDYRQTSIFFEFVETVEFMDDQGFVYNRTYSMREGPWNQVQTSFHHQLLRLKENGEEILVTYKTKGDVDPSGKRIITEIRTNEQGGPVWSDPGN